MCYVLRVLGVACVVCCVCDVLRVWCAACAVCSVRCAVCGVLRVPCSVRCVCGVLWFGVLRMCACAACVWQRVCGLVRVYACAVPHPHSDSNP